MSANASHRYVFDFELTFNSKSAIEWMRRHWTTSFCWSALYLIFIFGGSQVMKNRQPFRLQRALFFWNSWLALFSLIGVIRVSPEIIDILVDKGFRQSVCDNRYLTHEVSGLWLWLFVMSKLVEFGDTVFIVLRKQKLIFLHWYHHITVLIFTWYGYQQMESTGRWYMAINYTIHSVMYSYYAIRALGLKPPRIVPLFITTSQILQMVFAFFINFYSTYVKYSGSSCQTSDSYNFWGFLLYSSYLVLFIKFFVKAYLRSPEKLINKSQ